MNDQPIQIVDYDPSWPQNFTEQASELAVLLKPWLASAVEHVGSTAVPGMPAKPVVDILAPVHSLTHAREAVPALERAGWTWRPHGPRRDYRLLFLRPTPQYRTHHLYLAPHDDPHSAGFLAFRDALRTRPELRTRYASLKRQLAAVHRDDRHAYSLAKGDFVTRAVHEFMGPPDRP
ncbi:GrpB family protein [Streptomyces sp. NPDC088730]|uniref:GrpB family protein n=1 Tax=Streptomyces sp. NPDC088730 TaxID=3365877 RepID=UPI0037F592BF